MPHLTVEYSANLEKRIDVTELVRVVHEKAAASPIFPLAGIRTRAERRDIYRIADGHPDNVFIHIVVRMAHGRELSVREAFGKALLASVADFLKKADVRDRLALSLEIQEIDPVLNFKANSIRAALRDVPTKASA